MSDNKNEIKNSKENKHKEETKNPFKVRLIEEETCNILLKMESNLKEMAFDDDNLNNETDDEGDSSIDAPPLFTYPSEHSSLYEISDFEL